MIILLFFLLPLLFYALLLMWLVPLGYTVQSFMTLLTMPGQFFKIATNRTIRRNHALEHATVNVIEERYGLTHLAGYATEEGFVIRGIADPEMIYNASKIGLSRMQNGEKNLAIHQRCGTSLAASNFLASLLFVILLFSTKQANIWSMFLALILGSFTGSFVGPLTQKYITTATDLDKVEIMGYTPELRQVTIYTKQSEFEHVIE